MGICCCKNINRNSSSADNIKSAASSSPTSESSTDESQPMFALKSAHEFTSEEDEDDSSHFNLSMTEPIMCADATSELCPIAMDIIHMLSNYHVFINKHANSKNAASTQFELNQYDLLNLRDSYHHLISFHDSNTQFMRKLFNELMQINAQNGIYNLYDINNKIEKDQEKRRYFGNTMYRNISIIQTLNHLHWTVTNKFLNDHHVDNGKIEKIKDRNGKKSKFAFHHKFKIGSSEKKLRVGSVPNFEFEEDGGNVANDQMIKPRAFRKRERDKWREKELEITSDDDMYWMGKKGQRSESTHLLNYTKWERPLTSLSDKDEDAFDLTSFDAPMLDID